MCCFVLYSAPVLEGITTVPLVNGKANFTKLRVSMPADQLSLSFVVQNFEVTTSVEFSVVAPPPSTPQRHVSFLLTGDVRGVSSLSSAAIMLSITTALSSELNVDISRLVNVAVMVSIRNYYGQCLIVFQALIAAHTVAVTNCFTSE